MSDHVTTDITPATDNADNKPSWLLRHRVPVTITILLSLLALIVLRYTVGINSAEALPVLSNMSPTWDTITDILGLVAFALAGSLLGPIRVTLILLTTWAGISLADMLTGVLPTFLVIPVVALAVYAFYWVTLYKVYPLWVVSRTVSSKYILRVTPKDETAEATDKTAPGANA